MSFSDIEKAGQIAEEIAHRIRNSNGNLSIAYYKLEEILINYRKNGMDEELILPGLYEVDHEYNRTNPDGRSIGNIYADTLHEDLCNSNGIIHKSIEANSNISGIQVVELIMKKLDLPPSSALIIGPIAASILGLGVNAFCKHGTIQYK